MRVYHRLELVGFSKCCSDSGGLQLAVRFETKKKVAKWEADSGLMYGNLLCLSPGGCFNQEIGGSFCASNIPV